VRFVKIPFSLSFRLALAGALSAFACGSPMVSSPSDLPSSVSSPTPVATATPTPATAPDPTPTPSSTPATTPTPSTGLSYNQDLKRVFDSDCTGCHSASNPTAGYSMATYSAVMQDVRPGDPNCNLVKITRPNDVMYQNFSGDRAEKAALVYDWVVKYGAALNR
jgi:hypothetical protein